ncbi:MAG: hypothetical protein BGP11_10460 [Rhodobacterales bacterium 65-51]|nr:MAG: hypothetical protein BGP11_10460 [Rhodobacterales bacterium 65-51]
MDEPSGGEVSVVHFVTTVIHLHRCGNLDPCCPEAEGKASYSGEKIDSYELLFRHRWSSFPDLVGEHIL